MASFAGDTAMKNRAEHYPIETSVESEAYEMVKCYYPRLGYS